MAKIQGMSTTVKGKAGNQVYSTWKGIQILKTRVIPYNPQSPAQTTNRNIFKSLVDVGKVLNSHVIRYTFKELCPARSTTWGEFMKINQKKMAGGTFNFNNLEIARGTLAPVVVDSASYDEVTGNLIVNYSFSEQAMNSNLTDIVNLIVHEDSKDEFYISNNAIREDESIQINLPTGYDPGDLCLWIVMSDKQFQDPDFSSCSDSVCFVSVTAP